MLWRGSACQPAVNLNRVGSCQAQQEQEADSAGKIHQEAVASFFEQAAVIGQGEQGQPDERRHEDGDALGKYNQFQRQGAKNHRHSGAHSHDSHDREPHGDGLQAVAPAKGFRQDAAANGGIAHQRRKRSTKQPQHKEGRGGGAEQGFQHFGHVARRLNAQSRGVKHGSGTAHDGQGNQPQQQNAGNRFAAARQEIAAAQPFCPHQVGLVKSAYNGKTRSRQGQGQQCRSGGQNGCKAAQQFAQIGPAGNERRKKCDQHQSHEGDHDLFQHRIKGAKKQQRRPQCREQHDACRRLRVEQGAKGDAHAHRITRLKSGCDQKYAHADEPRRPGAIFFADELHERLVCGQADFPSHKGKGNHKNNGRRNHPKQGVAKSGAEFGGDGEAAGAKYQRGNDQAGAEGVKEAAPGGERCRSNCLGQGRGLCANITKLGKKKNLAVRSTRLADVPMIGKLPPNPKMGGRRNFRFLLFLRIFVYNQIRSSMQRIIIEAPDGKDLRYLVKLLRRLDFVRSVHLESEEFEEKILDEYIQTGPPMTLEQLRQRIKLAEAEDEAGLSIPDEELQVDF